MAGLNAWRDFISPSFLESGASKKFEICVSLFESLLYAQSVENQELRILIATKDELERKKFGVISERLKWIEKKYVAKPLPLVIESRKTDLTSEWGRVWGGS